MPMNSTRPETSKSTSDAIAGSLFDSVAKHAHKNLEAFTASWQAAGQSAQRTGADLVASATKLSEEQLRATRALATAKTPQEAFELQQQFARGLLEAYAAQTTLLSAALTNGFQAAVQPLRDRYAEASNGSAGQF